MIGPIIAGIVFSLLVIVLSFVKPNAGRIFLGIFFVAMGLGVNIAFLLTDPIYIVTYGRGAWLPLYRTLTESIITFNPSLFAILLIVFEVAMGLLMLSRGAGVKVGLIGDQPPYSVPLPELVSMRRREVERSGTEHQRSHRDNDHRGRRSIPQ